MRVLPDSRLAVDVHDAGRGPFRSLRPVPLEALRDLVLGSAWPEHQGPGCPGAVTIGAARPLKAGSLDGTLLRVPDIRGGQR